MSPFPQYRSQVLTHTVRQLNSLRDRTQAAMRKIELWGRWNLEAGLYPIYRWAPVRKTLKRQLKQATNKVVKRLSGFGDQPLKAISASDLIEEVVASLHLPPTLTQRDSCSRSKLELSTPASQIIPGQWLNRSLHHLSRLSRTWINLTSEALFPPTNAKMMTGRALPKPATAIDNTQTVRPASPLIRWVKACGTYLRKMSPKLPSSNKAIQTLAAPALALNGGLATHQKNQPVQGFATQLANKHLVLVTTDQTVLDILTVRQQFILKQKITWVLRRNGMRYRLQQARRRLSSGIEQLASWTPTRLFEAVSRQNQHSASQQVLAASSASFQPLPQFSRWVIKGLIGAIASLPFVAIPAIAAESAPQKPGIASIEAQWIDPAHLKTPLSWDELQGMASKRTQSQGWVAPQSSSGHLSQSPAAHMQHSFYAADNSIEIPVEAEFLGYEPHLLEQVLAWLDRVLVIMENAIARFWQWVGIFVVMSLAVLEKIKRFSLN